MTWLAGVQAVTSRCGGQPGELAVIGLEAFTALVRDALPGWGGQRIHGPICKTVFAALTSTEGVVRGHRRGLLRRVAAELGDLQRARTHRQETEAAMPPALAHPPLPRPRGIPALTTPG